MTKRLINWVVGVLILPLTVVISLSLEEYAWASSPTEQLRGYTDQVMKALENPTLSASARLETVRTLADQAFDVTETAKRALGLHWQQRTAAERGNLCSCSGISWSEGTCPGSASTAASRSTTWVSKSTATTRSCGR